MRAILVLLACGIFLTACDTTASLQELRAATPAADPYAASLASGYRDYAEETLVDYDWWISKYFADKGLMAAYGREVQPEEPGQWDIAASALPEMTGARATLMTALAQSRAAQPELSAQAVLAYDRWIEVQHYGWNEPEITARREAFYAALGRLQVAATTPANTAPRVETPPTPVETTSTILYFPFDSDRLEQSAQAALAKLVEDIKAAGEVSVVINGHADRAGSEAYNLKLSEHRAKFVESALIAAGVPARLLHYFAFGESDPAVPTPDGVREPRNRRVEIFIE